MIANADKNLGLTVMDYEWFCTKSLRQLNNCESFTPISEAAAPAGARSVPTLDLPRACRCAAYTALPVLFWCPPSSVRHKSSALPPAPRAPDHASALLPVFALPTSS